MVEAAGCRQAAKLAESAAQGDKRIVPIAAAGKPRVCTIMLPPLVTPGLLAVVVTVSTYLVPEAGMVCSQPQLLAAMAVAELMDWIVSVMLVRQDEAARIASDTLARIV